MSITSLTPIPDHPTFLSHSSERMLALPAIMGEREKVDVSSDAPNSEEELGIVCKPDKRSFDGD